MTNSDEKVGKFVQAITEYAEAQSRKIHREVEEFKAERMKEAEKEVLMDAYRLIQKEQAELHSQISLEMSRREQEARQALLSRRQDMMNRIFAEAEEQLLTHTAEPDYMDRMLRSLHTMAAELPAENTVYMIAERDKALLPLLEAACPEGSRVELSGDIRIGGMRGVSEKAGVIMDDTFDSKLDAQRGWFIRNSRLTVE